MGNVDTANPPQPLSAAFLAVIRPERAATPPDRITEDDEYLRMMWRMVRALEARAIERPENLPQIVELQERLGEVVNVAIAANAERYAIDPMLGASMAECARILGISKPSASERRARGVVAMGKRIDRAGAIRFAEAKREREAIAAAHERAVTVLADYRARHRVA